MVVTLNIQLDPNWGETQQKYFIAKVISYMHQMVNVFRTILKVLNWKINNYKDNKIIRNIKINGQFDIWAEKSVTTWQY